VICCAISRNAAMAARERGAKTAGRLRNWTANLFTG
jgi:hypothetical protein